MLETRYGSALYRCPKLGVFTVALASPLTEPKTICWQNACCGRLCGEESPLVEVQPETLYDRSLAPSFVQRNVMGYRR